MAQDANTRQKLPSEDAEQSSAGAPASADGAQQQRQRDTGGGVVAAPAQEAEPGGMPARAFPAQDTASLVQRAAALMEEGSVLGPPPAAEGPNAVIPETEPPRRLGRVSEP